MPAARFDILVHGFRSGASVQPVAALQLALKLDAATARMLAERFPCVVLSALPEEHAERARDELQRYGARVELRATHLGRGSSGERGSDPASQDRPASSSKDYELGEILAPLGQQPRETPARKAGHLSFPPELPATSVAPGAPSLAPPAVHASHAARSSLAGPRALHSLSSDEAPIQLAIELPARAWGEARRPMVVGELPKPAPRESVRARFKRWAVWGVGAVGPLVVHGVLFVVICALTLAAVSWALSGKDASKEGLLPFGNSSILGD